MGGLTGPAGQTALFVEVFGEEVAPESTAAGTDSFDHHNERTTGEHQHREGLTGEKVEEGVNHAAPGSLVSCLPCMRETP